MVETAIGGRRFVHELDTLIARRGKLSRIASENGTEMTSRAMLNWVNRNGVACHYIDRVKLQQNSFFETLNGKFRHGGLNEEVFTTLAEAQAMIDRWQHD